MTQDEFAEALRRLVGYGEDGGLSHEDLIEALKCAGATNLPNGSGLAPFIERQSS